MITLKTLHPFINENNEKNFELVKHFAEDENGEKYLIKQLETGILYQEAIDIFPCPYTYESTDIKANDEN